MHKLGKQAPKQHPHTLSFAKYVRESVLQPPAKVYYEYKIPPSKIGMFLNNKLGDCVFAGIAHMLMMMTAHSGEMVVPTEEDVVQMYSAVGGYVPGDPASDNGANIADALEYWRTIGFAGHRILGWAQIDHSNLLHRQLAVWLFGACDVGVQLPLSAENQFDKGENWELTVEDSDILGGHCIIQTGYGAEGVNYQTWGKGDQKASAAWDAKYCDEAYVVITEDWINRQSGLAVNHFDMAQLQEDLNALKI